MPRSSTPRVHTSRSWDAVAEWYLGWSGTHGSIHHRRTAIPLLLDLLAPAEGERVLDIGCGPGVLAPGLSERACSLVGVDRSTRLINAARKAHRGKGRFLVGDATALDSIPGLGPELFDAATFLLSIQDIDPLAAVLNGLRARLARTGRIAVVMMHPCFRVPRQSGWGWDTQRKLQFRRVDRYLTPLSVPMRTTVDGRIATRSYHRPLEHYASTFADAGFLIEALREVPSEPLTRTRTTPAQRLSDREFPMFLGMRFKRSS